MPLSLPLVAAIFAGPAATLPTELWPVTPEPPLKVIGFAPAVRKDRAVILIPGLKIHPLRPTRCLLPERHDWQEPKSELVKSLAMDADVFAFGYAQTVPLDVVAQSTGLREAVYRVKRAGYTEVALIGHSAGGVIARHFAEQYPEAGVSKVIQVASPNTGAKLATLKGGYPKAQAPFVHSLAPAPRQEAAGEARPVGPGVEFACVVCKLPRLNGDGLVATASQWPDDLREQGVPAAVVSLVHFEAMRATSGIRVIAALARERLPRWTPDRVEAAKKALFRDTGNDPKK